jgi:RNA polymerase sigma-70 factor (ECF subfamily)
MTVWHPGFARALRAAQTGDNEAFCDLWRMTNPALRRYLRVTAPRVVDDVASATWVRVARNLRQLPGGERDFRASVARIARDEAAMRRRNRPRRPDSLLDPIEVDTIRDAVGAGRAALGRESLTGETAVGLLTRLPDDVAEMVALRVVLGLDSGDTGALVGLRPGSVIVAVHSGLRRTSNLVGASAVRGSGPANPVGSPSPWALDRLLDLGPDGADGPDGP